MLGIGENYRSLKGNVTVPLPCPVPQAAPLDPQANLYTQAPEGNYGIFSYPPLRSHLFS